MCSVGTESFLGRGWLKSVSQQDAGLVLAALQLKGDPPCREGVKEEITPWLKGVGRAYKGASTSQRAHEGACPARGEVVGTEADAFGGDVKLTVSASRGFGQEEERERPWHTPGLPYPETVPAPRQVTGKARLTRCCSTQEGCWGVVGH